MIKICTVKECNTASIAQNLCSKHYQQARVNKTIRNVTESHGKWTTPEYKSWQAMKERCYNTKCKDYKYYGGRGITVCDRWVHSFIAFYDDMGDKPFKGAHIDRKENNGNYELSNCKWVSVIINNRHKSTTKLTMKKAREIRKLWKSKIHTQNELAFIYSIGRRHINDVINNKRWVE